MPKKFMWTNLTRGGVIPKKISKKIFLSLAAVILIGGFFVVKMVLADPIFSVSIDPIAVDIGQTKDIAFTVTSVDANKLKTIAVSVQNTGFSNPTSVVCPTDWSKIPAMPPILNGYVCDDPTGIGLSAPVITLNGLVAPSSPGMQNFSVSAINTDSEPKTENINVPIEVKNLAATASVNLPTTDINQSRDYNFTILGMVR